MLLPTSTRFEEALGEKKKKKRKEEDDERKKNAREGGKSNGDLDYILIRNK